MTIELGSNIKLTGFKDGLDPGSMVILKKMIGNQVRKISDEGEGFENLHLTLKSIHESENHKSKKYELHGKLSVSGKEVFADITGMNIFVTVDEVLKKLEHQLGRSK